MADLTIANLMDIVKNISKRVAGIATAVETVQADIDAQFTRYQGFDDDTGIGALLATACTPQRSLVESLKTQVAQLEIIKLAAAFQDTGTSPADAAASEQHSTVDAFFSADKSGLTNPLLANEFVVQFRAIHGNGSLSAANCSAPVETSYGTVSWDGGTPTDDFEDAPVDTDLYCGGLMEVYVDTQIETVGAAAVTLTFTGEDINGSPWTGTAVVTDELAAASTVEIVPAVAKTYPVLISAVAESGDGVDSGAITVRVKRPYTYSQ